MATIVSLGDIDIDLIVEVDHLPSAGQETFAQESRLGLAGSATNTAIVLARLGFDAAVAARVGEDEFGSRAVRILEELGVRTDLVGSTGEDDTGMNVVAVDAHGERTMIGLRGANRGFGGSPGWEEGTDWLHLSAYALLEDPQRAAALEAVDLARSRAIPVSVDIPSGVATILGPSLLPLVADMTIVAVGSGSLTRITGVDDVSAGAGRLAARLVAVTAGEQPFLLHRGGESLQVTPPRVSVVDTTGAGDSFVAGLIAASLWGEDLGTSAVIAGCLGAAATLRRGAGASLADLTSIRRLIDTGAWPDADGSWIEAAGRRLLG